MQFKQITIKIIEKSIFLSDLSRYFVTLQSKSFLLLKKLIFKYYNYVKESIIDDSRWMGNR